MFKRERLLSALPVANLSRTFKLKKRGAAVFFATVLLQRGQKQLRGQLHGNLREGRVFPLALGPENEARFPGSKANANSRSLTVSRAAPLVTLRAQAKAHRIEGILLSRKPHKAGSRQGTPASRPAVLKQATTSRTEHC